MSKTEMKIDPTRAAALVSLLQDVNARIIVAAQGRPVSKAWAVDEQTSFPYSGHRVHTG